MLDGVSVGRGRRVDGMGYVPSGMAALERSQLPSESLRMVSGDRARLSRAEMSSMVWEGVGAARMAGTKARATARVLEKNMLLVWCSVLSW